MLKGFGCLHQIDFSWEGFEWDRSERLGEQHADHLRKGKENRTTAGVRVQLHAGCPAGLPLGVPRPGVYEEVLNTDAAIYGGSGVGNPRFISSEPVAWQGRDHSIPVVMPPLGGAYFRYRPDMQGPV